MSLAESSILPAAVFFISWDRSVGLNLASDFDASRLGRLVSGGGGNFAARLLGTPDVLAA